jgi:Zn-finger nucleic acid-binding protein
MQPFQVGKVELDRCTFCLGLWFDGGELSQVLGKEMSPAMTPGMKTNRSCPECRAPMAPAELGGLRVETCVICKGIYLDRGELVALNGGKAVEVRQETPEEVARLRKDVTNWLDSLGA